MPPEHQVHKDLHGDLGTDTIRPGEHLEGTETMKQETVSRDRRGACGQVCLSVAAELGFKGYKGVYWAE